MRKLLTCLFLGSMLAFGACDGDDGPGGGGADTQGPDTPREDVPGVSSLTGVDTRVQVTPAVPSGSCDQGDLVEGPEGAAVYPWGGITLEGITYSCNRCPEGDARLQGQWRYFGYDETNTFEDYSVPTPDDLAEVMYIDGNTFYQRIYDSWEEDGGTPTVEFRGYYACRQQPEHPNKHYIFVITEVKPEGAQGWKTGDTFGADVPLFNDGGDWHARLFDNANANNNTSGGGLSRRNYCKFGSVAYGKTCLNPFE